MLYNQKKLYFNLKRKKSEAQELKASEEHLTI